MRWVSFFIVIGLLCLAGGCRTTSRWAMDDFDYAKKYSAPYQGDLLDKSTRMAKQSADARFVDNKSGWYAGAAYQSEPTSGGGQLGYFRYSSPSVESRVGLNGLWNDSCNNFLVGVDGGIRLQPPSRLAPFVGVGGFAGAGAVETLAVGTWLLLRDPDNPDDSDFRDDEDRDSPRQDTTVRESHSAFMAAVCPEVGVHYWLDGHTRLSATATYYVTTEGRDHDFWFFGVGVSFLFPGQRNNGQSYEFFGNHDEVDWENDLPEMPEESGELPLSNGGAFPVDRATYIEMSDRPSPVSPASSPSSRPVVAVPLQMRDWQTELAVPPEEEPITGLSEEEIGRPRW